MKLIQLNMWNGRLDKQILSFIDKQSPDLLCLQEAISIPGETAIFLSVEQIQAASDLRYTAFGPAFSIRFMQRMAGFGNAVLSRVPIQKSEVVFTNQEHQPDFDFIKHKSSNMRNFVHAVVEADGKPANIITHHGYWIHEHKNGNEDTMRQMKQLGEYIDSLDGPVILTGDFNLAPHSQSLDQINQRLRNLSVEHKLRTTRNQLTHKTEVCDYIFVNDLVKVKGFEASDELVSDHKALILEFDV